MVFAILLGVLIALLLFVGGLAGAIVGGGREDRSLLANTGIGLVGSLIGGTLWNLIGDRRFELSWGGFLASLIGSILLLLTVGIVQRRRTAAVAHTESPG